MSRAAENDEGVRPLLYYVSGHGYGHAVRSCDILAAFCRAHPETPVEINSPVPAAFFRNRLPFPQVRHREIALDVGMVQLDSVRVDVAATLERVVELGRRHQALLDAEARHMEAVNACAVASDIAALPLEAAARQGLPRLAVGNFAWNWIYAEFRNRDARWAREIERFERAYAMAELLLRLPFSEPMTVFPVRRDLPLVACPGTPRRDDLQRHTGADPEKPWILLSFTSLGWGSSALAQIRRLREVAFFTVRPLAWEESNVHAVDRDVVPFSDVLASMDAVVTKPGYGILSECMVNRKPMIYVEREDFCEYPILAEAARRFLPSVHLPAQDLYAGRLEGAIRAILAREWPAETLPSGGDELAASFLQRACEGRGLQASMDGDARLRDAGSASGDRTVSR